MAADEDHNMNTVKRSAAIALFGNSYEVDYGAPLPHFEYSDFISLQVLDGIATRWSEKPSDLKVVKIHECLGPRRSTVTDGWNKFFYKLLGNGQVALSSDLTAAVVDHAATGYENARKIKSGSKYRTRSIFESIFGDGSKPLFSDANRIFSDLRVVIVPLPDELYLSDHFLAPGDKIYHLLGRNILEGTKIVEYTIRDRYTSSESPHRHTVKYTALTGSSTMPLHFELHGGDISMASYGDCTSPHSAGPLFLTLDQAKKAEASVWEKAAVRLQEYGQSK
jgi:hypothetical protein